MDLRNESCSSGQSFTVRPSCVAKHLTLYIARKISNQILLYLLCLYAALASTIYLKRCQ